MTEQHPHFSFEAMHKWSRKFYSSGLLSSCFLYTSRYTLSIVVAHHGSMEDACEGQPMDLKAVGIAS